MARTTLALLALLLAPGCVGTPLPDPPSLASELVSLTTTPEVDTVRLVGRAGAVRPGSATIRVTDPAFTGVLVAVNADGSFGRIVPGRPGDTFFVELVLTDEDRFLGAFTAPAGGVLTPTSSGPDTDGDLSPDAVDCADMDPTMSGARCTSSVVCRADSDCAVGQTCVAGVCSGTPTCTTAPETCNGLDDDCNGLVDEGDPNGGVACRPTTTCPQGVLACDPTGPTCLDAPIPEVCANGIDEDCDGVADDGC